MERLQPQMIQAKLCLGKQNTTSKYNYLGDETTCKIIGPFEKNNEKEQKHPQQAYENIQIQFYEENVPNGVHRNTIQYQQVPEQENYLIRYVPNQDEGDSYKDIIDEYTVNDCQSISKREDETVQINHSLEVEGKDIDSRCTTPEAGDPIVVKDSLHFTRGSVENSQHQIKILTYNNNNDEIDIDSSRMYYIQSGSLMKIEDNSSCSSVNDQIVEPRAYDHEKTDNRILPTQILPNSFKYGHEKENFDLSTSKVYTTLEFDGLNENALNFSGRIHELLHIGDSSDDEESYKTQEPVTDANSNFPRVENEVDEQPDLNPSEMRILQPLAISDNRLEIDLTNLSDCEANLSESTESCYSRGSYASGCSSPVIVVDDEDQPQRPRQKSTVRRGRRPLANKKCGPCCDPAKLPARKRCAKTPTTSSSTKELHVCRVSCKKAFSSSKALHKHEAHCAKRADLSCKYCNFKTKHRSAIKPHVQQHVLNNDEPLDRACQPEGLDASCFTVTSTSSESKVAYENRLRSSIGTTCRKCGRSSTALDSHTLCQSCLGQLVFQCKSCPQQGAAFHPMRLHVIRCHFEKVYRCVRCRQSYSYALDLKRHLGRCLQNDKPFLCGVCGFRTASQRNLSGHVERVHPNPEELLACIVCGASFGRNNVSGLRRHQDRCSGRSRVSCEHCHFDTASKFSLRRHIFNKHLAIIVGEDLSQQLTCYKCGKRFGHFYDRDTHEQKCAA